MLYSRLLLDYHPFELTDSVMFFGELSPFCEKKFKKKKFCNTFPVFQKKSPNFFFKIPKIANNLIRFFRFYIFHIFEYCQTQLNILVDYCHLSNVTKLKIKNTAESLI
jgi:hypothetical protein